MQCKLTGNAHKQSPKSVHGTAAVHRFWYDHKMTSPTITHPRT